MWTAVPNGTPALRSSLIGFGTLYFSLNNALDRELPNSEAA